MAALDKFHEELIGSGSLTPKHSSLYASGRNGFSGAEKDAEKFLATFVLGLYRTWDPGTNSFHRVAFAVPKFLDEWAIGQINSILQTVREKRAKLSKAQRVQGSRMIVQAVSHLDIGSRVFAIAEEPSHWVAFGFVKDQNVPEWLSRGLHE